MTLDILISHVLTPLGAQDSSRNHKIDDDGYNIGRNYFVERAVAGSHWGGKWWKADLEWRTGLMPRGRRGACVHDLSFKLCLIASQVLTMVLPWTVASLSSQSGGSENDPH